MPSTTVRYNQITNVAALSVVGNAGASEGRGANLSGTQVRTLCGLGTTDTPQWAGATLTGDLLFNANNTYDVGNGTYNPRTVRAATSVLTPLLNNTNAAALIVGNSTYGISSPGRITASGGITSPHVSYPNTSEQFGYGATAGDYSVSVGRNASSGGNATGVAVGYGATSDYSSVSLGYSATAGWRGVAIGANAITFDGWGYGAIAIGKSSQGLHEGSIALGYGAITSAANQLMIGAVTVPITQQRFMTGGGSLTFANETGTFLTAANNGLLTLGNSTYGVTVPGAATFSGDISMSKTSAQGYIRAYAIDGVKNVATYHNGTDGYVVSNAASLVLDAVSNISISKPVFHYGNVQIQAGLSSNLVIGNQAGGYPYLQLTATNGGFLQAGVDKDAALSNQNYMVVSGSNNLSLKSGTGHVMLNPGNSLIPIMGATSSFPAMKRSGTTLAFRLGDDSADAPISCAGITASGAIQETYRTSSLDPTTSDIGSGKRQGWYNTVSLEFRDWVNVGGTLLKSAAYT